MRGRQAKQPDEASVDLTPMLDVVFILLIFFIVTSTFIQEEALGLEPPPPPSNTQSDPENSAILIFVDQDNLITVNGRLTDITGVRANMERLRAENPESALIIQAHPQARTGTIVKIRDEAYNAQMNRVNIVQSEGD
ncbi:MAG: biopolymer transporter ExbD [Henriciella sp.]|jgi:biopolymer transport protein ExbD|uniref:ExbD/TolR family protein n=1 Tax=Henriciella sp. TaxID=1968823 RepID=UPI000C0C81B3|nr:biopolymer transporter ExbD [Henriciella sp.]MAN72923.1 biopolymer transporter ExbD [Henriciella sp.]MBF33257.1 biopolymer transporter ExbD [Hyphomonadaceae bacterium]MBK76024.1 biopolymer transporter ExbD [Henriciella sp.]PHR78157.1 MAG: biopolymer transporter ExbD [Henriciella sp.]|tara:strand:+ start:452 stop:862 length:411 start_codon:yes stop_codon:yes gene_type:complete